MSVSASIRTWRRASRKNWHDTQVITQNAVGTVEVQMKVCLSPELDNPILPWAGKMTIPSPQEPQDHIHKTGEMLMARNPKRLKREGLGLRGKADCVELTGFC